MIQVIVSGLKAVSSQSGVGDRGVEGSAFKTHSPSPQDSSPSKEVEVTAWTHVF